MLKLNRMTDYAVVMLTHMGETPAPTITAAQVAAESNMPLPTVAKLLKALTRQGILTSQRGAIGGYRLARPAAEISVADIITALEGPIALTSCVDGAADACDVQSVCPVRGNWNRVNDAIRGALETVSLADMSPAPAAPDFGFPAPAPRAASRSEVR